MIIHAYKDNMSTSLTFGFDMIEEGLRTVEQMEQLGWKFDDRQVLDLLDTVAKQNAFKMQVG